MEYIQSATEGRIAAPVFGLSQNYPNPFNPSTLIHYQLKSAGKVDLSVFDIRGRLVQRMVSAFQEPGYYKVRWVALDKKHSSLPSGIYICRITVRDDRGGRVLYSKIRKMSLIR